MRSWGFLIFLRLNSSIVVNIMQLPHYRSILRFLPALALCLMLLPSCHSTKHVASKGDRDKPVTETTIHTGHLTKSQKRIVAEAKTWLGTPYKYAKAEKGKGTDCSGMVMKVYETATGIKIPRNSTKQAEYCKKVGADKVKAGDLVFFATGKDPKKVSHVGIVIDNEQFIHASSSKGVVAAKFENPYFKRTFVMFGKVAENVAGNSAESTQSEDPDIL